LEDELRRILELLSTDPLDAAQAALGELLRWSECGPRLTQPWKVVLAGEPNVGKSSLINALLGYDRAIVFDQPGTTRDLLTATTALEGWPVELTDTAGLRNSADRLESSGIERAAKMIAEAPRRVGVLNKVDLLPPAALQADPSLISTSVATGKGLEQLQSAIAARLVPEVPNPGTPLPFLSHQIQLLTAARAANTAEGIERQVRALLG
jgi:tRNA modification GTPase